jgi:hypothetical protein
MHPECSIKVPNAQCVQHHLRFGFESQKPIPLYLRLDFKPQNKCVRCFRPVLRPPHAFVAIARFFFESQNQSVTCFRRVFTTAQCACRHCAIWLRFAKMKPSHLANRFCERIINFTVTTLAFFFEAQASSSLFCDSASHRKHHPIHFAILFRIAKSIPSGGGDPLYHRAMHLSPFRNECRHRKTYPITYGDSILIAKSGIHICATFLHRKF